jgi:hypothetical protein
VHHGQENEEHREHGEQQQHGDHNHGHGISAVRSRVRVPHGSGPLWRVRLWRLARPTWVRIALTSGSNDTAARNEER